MTNPACPHELVRRPANLLAGTVVCSDCGDLVDLAPGDELFEVHTIRLV